MDAWTPGASEWIEGPVERSVWTGDGREVTTQSDAVAAPSHVRADRRTRTTGPSLALAQARVATLDDLRRELRPGDFISVVQTAGESVSGRLRRFGDTDLDIEAENRPTAGQHQRLLDVTIPRSAIQSLERPRDSSRNGALIGAGIGGGFALTMFVWALSVDRNEIDEWASSYLAGGGICTGIGALAGWAIDFAHSRPHVRFDAPATGTMTIRAVPLLSRGPGIALVVSF